MLLVKHCIPVSVCVCDLRSVPGEKRAALLAEVSRLREERNLDPAEAAGEDKEYVSQQPCRGTVNITNIQLPLKVEFVCSSHSRAGNTARKRFYCSLF